MTSPDGLRLDIVNDDLKLYQYRDGLTFGTDALLLAAYVRGDADARAVEFGGGTGIVSLLLAVRNKVKTVLSLEAQKEYADLIEQNVALNGLQGRVTAVFGDLRDRDSVPGEGYDLRAKNCAPAVASSACICPTVFPICFRRCVARGSKPSV